MANYNADLIRYHGTTVAATLAVIRNKMHAYARTNDILVIKDANGIARHLAGDRLFYDLTSTTPVVRAQATGVARVEFSSSNYLQISLSSSGTCTLSPSDGTINISGILNVTGNITPQASIISPTATDIRTTAANGNIRQCATGVINDDASILLSTLLPAGTSALGIVMITASNAGHASAGGIWYVGGSASVLLGGAGNADDADTDGCICLIGASGGAYSIKNRMGTPIDWIVTYIGQLA